MAVKKYNTKCQHNQTLFYNANYKSVGRYIISYKKVCKNVTKKNKKKYFFASSRRNKNISVGVVVQNALTDAVVANVAIKPRGNKLAQDVFKMY